MTHTSAPLGLARLTRLHGRAAFALQAVAGAAWWLAVATVPGVRHATLGQIDPVVMALLDVPLFVLASALAAIGLRWAVWIVVPWTLLVTAGMIAYATFTGQAGWGALLMVASSGLGVAAGALVVHGRLPAEWLLAGPFRFCPARTARTRMHVVRTFTQTVMFWGLFLGVIPLIIVGNEARWGLIESA